MSVLQLNRLRIGGLLLDASLAEGEYRRLTQEEYDRVLDWMDCMGIEDGFVQELSSAKEEYTPDFSLQGVDRESKKDRS